MKEIELINKRKPREKHFLQEDGTIVAKVYSDNIHYKKGKNYVEIDNDLIKEKGNYTNKSNEYKVNFPDEVSSSIMKMEKDNYYLDIKLVNAKKTKAKKKKKVSKYISELTYKDILDNIDIKYQNLPTKVKETIILNSKKYKRLIFEIFTNLQLIEKDNRILALEQDQAIFIIEKPYMQDSNGNKNTNIYYNLSKQNGYYNLELILDKKWLTSKDTKFPVYVDPTILNTVNEENIEDTYIYQGDENEIKFDEEFLKAGVEKVNGKDVINRTLIKFGLPEIGTGSEIINAEITLTGYLSSTGIPTEYEHLATIHKITSDWRNEAYWEQMNDKYDKHVEGIICCTRSTTDGTTLLGELCSGDITNLVKKWYKDEKNYGLLIKSAQEKYVDENFPCFFSNDNIIPGNPRPYIYITYRNQNGLEGYLNYKEQMFSEGSTYVNTYNGNLVGTFDIGYTVGEKSLINLNLIYNTNDVILNKSYGFGNGYKLNYNQTIKPVEIDFLDYLEYIDEDGTTHYLQIDYTTDPYSYIDEDGIGLTAILQENICTMVDKENNKKTFTKSNDLYYLSEIIDAENNKTIITMDTENRITYIKDQNNEGINISYNRDQIIVTNPCNVTEINYLNNKISTITNNIGTKTIEYNSNNLISNIIDINDIKINYQYYEEKPYKIKKVTQYGVNNSEGQSFEIEYGFNSTTIIDNKKRIETLIFNEYGNLISSNSLDSSENINNAYSITQTYGNEYEKNKNKLLTSSIPVKYIKNYLVNTSFENDNDNFQVEDNEYLLKSYSTEYSNFGSRSLKLESLQAGGILEQSIQVPKGDYYTFSGFFKSGSPFEITLLYADKDGAAVETKQLIESSNDFERSDITIYYDKNATTDLRIIITFLSANILYIDDVQLESGDVANNYNIIENSDFSNGYSDWEVNVWNENNELLDKKDYFSIEKINDNKVTALKIKMEPLNTTVLKKSFPIKGKKGDLYTVSFWYKNDGVVGCRPYAGNNVLINYLPVDGEQEYCTTFSENLNPNKQRWQYFTYRNRALEDYKEIQLIFQQNTEANDFYITNISFYKELASGEYKYDEEGNVVAINNQSNEEHSIKYNNNQLTNLINTNGNDLNIEYDKEKITRPLNIITNTLSSTIKYDEKGNPIQAKVSKKYSNELNDGIYQIRCKGTNDYLNYELNNVFTKNNTCSNTKWLLTKINDRYKISYSLLPEYSLSITNGEQLVLTKENKNNLFILEKTENGSYYIKMNKNNEYKYLKVDELILKLSDKNSQSPEFEFYIEMIEEEFFETSSTYSDDGKFLTSTTDSNFNTTYFTRDEVTGKLMSETNPNGVKTDYIYNDKELLTKIINNDKKIVYNYDNNNYINEIVEGSRKYKFNYNEFLETETVKVGDNITLITNEYEPNNGNLVKITYGNNNIIEYEYDIFDRLQKLKREDGTYKYSYDNNGNAAKIIFNNNCSKFRYDISNRLYKFNYNNFEIKYHYDGNNNVTNKQYKIENKINSLENVIDNEETIKSIINDNEKYDYEYDSLGRQIKKIINEQFPITYQYIKNGKRTTSLLKSINFYNNNYEYTYDKLNNINEIYYNNQLCMKYYYDSYNQLIKEEDFHERKIIEYIYDILGNIQEKKITGMDDEENIKQVFYKYENANWVDQLTNFDGEDILYDSIGNPTKIGNNILLAWINGRMLKEYINNDKDIIINYSYNEDGIRNKKVINGITTEYLLEEENIIYEKRNNETIYYLYDLTGVSGIEYNDIKYHYLKNIHGDVIGILDQNNEIIVTYEYDSWGKVLSIKDSLGNPITDKANIGHINPFRYRSYYYDTETELYYLNNRYYNPNWGRYLNADGIVGANEDINSYNIYAYVSNNPINKIDPNGNFAIPLPIPVAGALLVFGAAVLMMPQTKAALSNAAETWVHTITSAGSKINSKTTKSKKDPTKKKKEQEEKYYVYTLRQRETNKVEYVGRTTSIEQTKYRHKRNPFRSHLEMNREYTGISKMAARGMEQYLIEQCKTKNRNKDFPMNNQINGLRDNHKLYEEYWDAATALLDDHIVKCN